MAEDLLDACGPCGRTIDVIISNCPYHFIRIVVKLLPNGSPSILLLLRPHEHRHTRTHMHTLSIQSHATLIWVWALGVRQWYWNRLEIFCICYRHISHQHSYAPQTTWRYLSEFRQWKPYIPNRSHRIKHHLIRLNYLENFVPLAWENAPIRSIWHNSFPFMFRYIFFFARHYYLLVPGHIFFPKGISNKSQSFVMFLWIICTFITVNHSNLFGDAFYVAHMATAIFHQIDFGIANAALVLAEPWTVLTGILCE